MMAQAEAVRDEATALARVRAANRAVGAWLAAPSEAGWQALRRELTAMEAGAADAATWPGDGELARECAAYRRQLTALRERLLAWQEELRLRRGQLRQEQASWEERRAWAATLAQTTA
ncbi:MAG: hypothetical protein ACRD2F_02340 [Terriglobales bacterium]